MKSTSLYAGLLLVLLATAYGAPTLEELENANAIGDTWVEEVHSQTRQLADETAREVLRNSEKLVAVLRSIDAEDIVRTEAKKNGLMHYKFAETVIAQQVKDVNAVIAYIAKWLKDTTNVFTNAAVQLGAILYDYTLPATVSLISAVTSVAHGAVGMAISDEEMKNTVYQKAATFLSGQVCGAITKFLMLAATVGPQGVVGAPVLAKVKILDAATSAVASIGGYGGMAAGYIGLPRTAQLGEWVAKQANAVNLEENIKSKICKEALPIWCAQGYQMAQKLDSDAVVSKWDYKKKIGNILAFIENYDPVCVDRRIAACKSTQEKAKTVAAKIATVCAKNNPRKIIDMSKAAACVKTASSC